MTANNDELRECREAFEAVMEHRLEQIDLNWSAKWDDGEYVIQAVQYAWEGWQAALAWSTRANEDKGGEAVACWSLAHKSGGGPLFADCIYDNFEDAQHDADALNSRYGDLAPIPLYTSPRATAEDVRDAERYRRVRGSCGEFVRYAGCGDHHLLQDDKLDQAIDQALAAERGVK